MVDVSCAVLAGGQSRRLGTDKAFLRVDGQPLIARTVERLRQLSDDVFIVGNDARKFASLEVPVVRDVYVGQGALAGIHAALQTARHDLCLVVACDMPFLNLRLLRYMIILAPGYDVVVPRVGDHVEPLHALYHRRCLPAIEEILEAGERQIIVFYPRVRVRYVDAPEIEVLDPEHLSFFNVNTPADWERAQELFRGGTA